MHKHSHSYQFQYPATGIRHHVDVYLTMPSCGFKLSKRELGHNDLGVGGNRTCLTTPGPGAYNPYPFMNPIAHRTTIGRYFPDRTPGFRNVVDRMPAPWRPEPMSLSRLQSEQPLVHYASATFWAWPEQRRRTAAAIRHERELNNLTAKGHPKREAEWHEEVLTHGTIRDPISGLGRSRSESALRKSLY